MGGWPCKDGQTMSEIADSLCAALPAEPISVADVFAVKQKAHPDVDPMLGLQPSPRENVIVLHVTDGPEMTYLGVEENGWVPLVTFSIEEAPTIEAAVTEHADIPVDWAKTYYDGETFALLKRGG